MTLTAAERAELDEAGFVRIAACSSAEAAVMQEAVWDELRRVHGVRRDDVASWPRGPVFGLQHVREAPTFAPIGGASLRGALDQLLGAGTWDVPKRWGALLVTFPRPGLAWTVPHHVWHADFPFDRPAVPLQGVKVFAFVSDVTAGMGGTLVVAGSHRLVERAVATMPPVARADTRRTRLRILAGDRWLQALSSPGGGDRVQRFMASSPLRVVELTGRAGEVVLTHPWLLHCPAPNCATAPRFMRSLDLYRRECHPAVFRLSASGGSC